MSVGEVEKSNPVRTKGEGEAFGIEVGAGYVSVVDTDDALPIASDSTPELISDILSDIILIVIILESMFGYYDRFLLHLLGH